MKKLSGGKALAVVAVAGGALVASVAPVLADVSAESPSTAAVRVETNAKWKTFGAVAEVDVTYACQPGTQGYLNLNVTQAVFGSVANGSGYLENLTCTGGFQTVKLNVTANGKAFTWGKAFARVDLRTYQGNTARDEREITILP